jgi:hypothetical protein
MATIAVIGAAAPGVAGAASIVVDHTTTDPSVIPQSALDTARALTMNFSHASVGGNIWGGLGALQTESSSRYAFPHWSDNSRGNPGWQAKVDDFEDWVASHAASYTVFLNKFCYIDQDATFTYYRDSMVRLAAANPSKKFVWFTMPIQTSGTDNALRAAFNGSVRAYAQSHDIVLFDLADIESHQPSGTAVTSGGHEALFEDYSTDGGHLNGVGSRRMAGAMWQLMARIGGWSPSGGSSSSSSSSSGGGSSSSSSSSSSGGGSSSSSSSSGGTSSSSSSSSGGSTGGSSSGGCATSGPVDLGALLLGLLPAQALLRRRRRSAR